MCITLKSKILTQRFMTIVFLNLTFKIMIVAHYKWKMKNAPVGSLFNSRLNLRKNRSLYLVTTNKNLNHKPSAKAEESSSIAHLKDAKNITRLAMDWGDILTQVISKSNDSSADIVLRSSLRKYTWSSISTNTQDRSHTRVTNQAVTCCLGRSQATLDTSKKTMISSSMSSIVMPVKWSRSNQTVKIWTSPWSLILFLIKAWKIKPLTNTKIAPLTSP